MTRHFPAFMLNFQPLLRSRLVGFSALFVCLFSLSVDAVVPTIRLSPKPSSQPKVVRGFLRGTVGLHNIVGEKDQRKKRCMGYGSATPDHQLSVTNRRSKLSLQVRSRAKDTTLFVRGPNNSIFCADDSALGKDAGLILSNLKPGLYEVWVGAFDNGDRFSYTLSIR